MPTFKRNLIYRLLLLLITLAPLMLMNCGQSRCNLNPQYYEDIAPGKNGAVSGQIINIDAAKGIPGIILEIIRQEECLTFDCKTDERGKYIIKGRTEGRKVVHAVAQGLASESTVLDVKPGEKYENVNFILGRGKISAKGKTPAQYENVSVKGKLIAANDKQPVKGAMLYFGSCKEGADYSGGWTKTDRNGEYHLTGLKGPGQFELSIVDRLYCDVDDNYTTHLRTGENILNFKLKPKRKEDIDRKRSVFFQEQK
ncbi:MAG: carboxypeptidase regulatory-like domain-containing protein [bacterium]|nr:carboxypeptidase regulatory-like domain-containing protein [bacterium]